MNIFKTISIIILFIPFLLFAQVKSEINSHLPDCKLNLLSESKDTIQFVTQCECYFLHLDTNILKTQVIYYCDSSTIRQVITFNQGNKDSIYKEFYKNGQLKVKCNYKDGNREGYYVSHYENGEIRCVGVYKMNKFIGSEFKYWDNGTIAELRSYSNGIPPLFGQSIYFNNSGKEIKENEFLNLWLGWKN